MKLLKLLVACCFLPLFASADNLQPSLIPIPAQMTAGSGTYAFTQKSTIGCADEALKPAAQYLQSLLSKATGYSFKIVKKGGTIRLTTASGLGKAGAYTLNADQTGVVIGGEDYQGIINGIATLRQLFCNDIESETVVAGKTWTIPYINVKDEPRFQWRGMELDCSRHFFSKAEIMKLMDVLALYKINRFHWHLTDDQGWRIEIKQYPLLTSKGGWRTYNNQDSTCIRNAKAEDNPELEIQQSKIRQTASGTEYGGFYTQDDVREIVAYAQVRGIEVIPEIDMPGHSLMAINNYDGLSCFKQTGWGKLFTTPMCPGKDTMIKFCENVWSEVFDLFPSKYVHIGGDEVDMKNWKKCPDCQKRMKDNNIQTESQLQTWFTHHMEQYFEAHGKKMIGWDEIIEGGLTPNMAVMWWRTWAPNAPKQTVSHGNQLIHTPNSLFYLDNEEDRNSIPSIYAFDPVKDMTEAEQQLVLGVQGNLWTEWVPSFNRMWYRAFPRILAVAEKAWSKPENMNLDCFNHRLVENYSRLQALGVTYRTPDLGGFYRTNVFTDKATINLTCADPSAEIRYTTDGTIPQVTSTLYTGPFTIDKATSFIFRTFGKNGRKGDFVKCDYFKEDYAPAAKVETLADGLQAEWHEYAGADCAGIEAAKVNGTYTVNGVAIPEEVKGDIGLIITGFIDVPEDAVYTFALMSDDGSYLKIDGQMVVDNDGEHSPREIIGQHAMRKGLHPVYARYFDHNGGRLSLRVLDQSGNEVKVGYFH